MNLSFLAPLFLAGLGLALVPWFIHRIRRPERKPIPFSSLLFVPKLDKQVIERRRLQHLLLLLLRIAVLALLAFAFSRPFRSSPTVQSPGKRTLTAHVLLFDQSMSMNAGEALPEARAKAREVLGGIPGNDPVVLIGFGKTARTIRPLDLMAFDGGARRKEFERLIDLMEATQEGTDFQAALSAAVAELRSVDGEPEDARGVIHLISDLQESGLEGISKSGWRLQPEIEVRPYAVGREDVPNRSVVDVAIRPLGDGEFRVAAKIRNWTMTSDVPFLTRLYVGGELRGEQSTQVQRHHSAQVVFTFQPDLRKPFDGWIEIEGDGLDSDNRRYFAWHPPAASRVMLLEAGSGGEDWPSGWFSRAVLDGARDDSFQVITIPEKNADQRIGDPVDRPDVVIAGEFDGTHRALGRPLLTYLETGGRAILTLSPSASPTELNGALLSDLGLTAKNGDAPSSLPSSYRLIDWIDFEHPVFTAFQAPRYNDFSLIRVSDFQAIAEPEKALGDGDGARVLARLESASPGSPGAPALIEVAYGEGRALIWTFPFDPGVTNLPKSPRFAPIVFEMLRYLVGERDSILDFTVGDPAATAGVDSMGIRGSDGIVHPVGQVEGDRYPATFQNPGIVTSRTTQSDDPVVIGVANPDPAESNPLRLDPEVFRTRVGSPLPLQTDAIAGAVNPEAPATLTGEKRIEFGLVLLVAMLGLLFVELWYAPRLIP